MKSIKDAQDINRIAELYQQVRDTDSAERGIRIRNNPDGEIVVFGKVEICMGTEVVRQALQRKREEAINELSEYGLIITRRADDAPI